MRKGLYREGCVRRQYKGQPSDAALSDPRVAFRPAIRILASTIGLVELPVWVGATGVPVRSRQSCRRSFDQGFPPDAARNLPVRWLELRVGWADACAGGYCGRQAGVGGQPFLTGSKLREDKARAKRVQHCIWRTFKGLAYSPALVLILLGPGFARGALAADVTDADLAAPLALIASRPETSASRVMTLHFDSIRIPLTAFEATQNIGGWTARFKVYVDRALHAANETPTRIGEG